MTEQEMDRAIGMLLGKEKQKTHTAEEVEKLLKETPCLNRSSHFTHGQLIQKKKGIYNPYKYPFGDQPAMYVGEIDNPQIKSQAQYLRESSIVKIVDCHGDIFEILCDPSLFEPYNPEDHKEKQAGADY